MDATSRTRAGWSRRAGATVVTAVLAVAAVAGCQPVPGEFQIKNQTAEPLMLWSQVVQPGEVGEFSFDEDEDCFPRLELVTPDLELQATLAR